MTTLSIDVAELTRIVKATEPSTAKDDDSRPALPGICAGIDGATLTVTACDGFYLSPAHPSISAQGVRRGRAASWVLTVTTCVRSAAFAAAGDRTRMGK